jgi:hypothetical protein
MLVRESVGKPILTVPLAGFHRPRTPYGGCVCGARVPLARLRLITALYVKLAVPGRGASQVPPSLIASRLAEHLPGEAQGLGRVGGDRDDHPDVIAPAPDFEVGAGSNSGALLLGQAAFKPADDGSPTRASRRSGARTGAPEAACHQSVIHPDPTLTGGWPARLRAPHSTARMQAAGEQRHLHCARSAIHTETSAGSAPAFRQPDLLLPRRAALMVAIWPILSGQLHNYLKTRRGTSYRPRSLGRVISGASTSTTSISVRNWTLADSRWLAWAVAECSLSPTAT